MGSFEQHGDHLPLSTDTLIAAVIAREVAAAYDLLLLPPITISCSHEHAAWAGTVSISAPTLHAIVRDVAESLWGKGVGRLLIVNGHGGNYVLSNVVQQASVPGAAGPRMALFPTGHDWHAARVAAGHSVLDGSADMHAGELETSILLHAMPDVVRPGYEHADHAGVERPHLLTLGLGPYTGAGVIGYPSLATAEKGKGAIDALVRLAGAHLEAMGHGGAGRGPEPRPGD